MIAYLKGTVLEKGKDFIILLVGDIGYRVSVFGRLLAAEKGAAVSLYTHQIVREDSQELCGFPGMKELEFFWRLTSVSGVGPKMAMHLLALGEIDSLARAIDKGDVGYLASAQGVGKKSAQRVVLELKGKLVGGDEVSGTSSEAISALENLGYAKVRARDAVAAQADDLSTEEKVKLALRHLSKRP